MSHGTRAPCSDPTLGSLLGAKGRRRRKRDGAVAEEAEPEGEELREGGQGVPSTVGCVGSTRRWHSSGDAEE